MRDLEKAAAVCDKAKRASGRVEALRMDVADVGSVCEAIDAVRERSGDVPDVLVNNAATGILGAVEEVSNEELRAVFDTNLFGLVAVLRAVCPAMRARGSGVIINVGSVGGRVSMRGLSAYSASKFAVVAMTDALRRELRPFGVHVSLIEPGGVRTELIGPSRAIAAAARTPKSPYRETMERITQLMQLNYERAGNPPESVAEVIARAATAHRPAPRYLVGADAHLLALLGSVLSGRTQDVVLDAMFDWIMSLGATFSRPATVTAAPPAPAWRSVERATAPPT